MSSKNLEFDLENKSGYEAGRPLLKTLSRIIMSVHVYKFYRYGPNFLHLCFRENNSNPEKYECKIKMQISCAVAAFVFVR